MYRESIFTASPSSTQYDVETTSETRVKRDWVGSAFMSVKETKIHDLTTDLVKYSCCKIIATALQKPRSVISMQNHLYHKIWCSSGGPNHCQPKPIPFTDWERKNATVSKHFCVLFVKRLKSFCFFGFDTDSEIPSSVVCSQLWPYLLSCSFI